MAAIRTKSTRPERVTLAFRPGDRMKKVVSNLSAAVVLGEQMFLGSDEGTMLERLEGSGSDWGGHERFALAEFVDIDPDAEADIEGLAADDGWLWVVGSHARTRAKLEPDANGLVDVAALAVRNDIGPRCLLARLPLVQGASGWQPVRRDGPRRAGMLKQIGVGNALAKALRKDPLVGPFTRVCAKEGGLDIEGIAVSGSRVALGLRGPVVRTYALLLELNIEAKPGGQLKLAGLRKRLLDLEGLGIRDLKRLGSDLLILAGPTTGLSGPCYLYRWKGWLEQPAVNDDKLQLHKPELLLELPTGRGEDHPEGIAGLPETGGPQKLMIVCDSPSAQRLGDSGLSLACDIVELPGGGG